MLGEHTAIMWPLAIGGKQNALADTNTNNHAHIRTKSCTSVYTTYTKLGNAYFSRFQVLFGCYDEVFSSGLTETVFLCGGMLWSFISMYHINLVVCRCGAGSILTVISEPAVSRTNEIINNTRCWYFYTINMLVRVLYYCAYISFITRTHKQSSIISLCVCEICVTINTSSHISNKVFFSSPPPPTTATQHVAQYAIHNVLWCLKVCLHACVPHGYREYTELT